MNPRRWGALLLLTLFAASAGLAFGATRLDPAALWRGLTDPRDAAAPILLGLRLPRVLLGLLVGGSLAVSGAVLQAVVRNPLADPYLLGLSGGAALAAVVVIALGLGGTWTLPMAAFAGALGALALVYRLGVGHRRRPDAQVLLLAGVVVSAVAGALVGAILMLSDAANLRNAFLWMLGGLGNASWPAVLVFALYAILPLGLLFRSARAFDLLVLGDETARPLGVEPADVRRLAALATGFLTALAVATCGMIGFVGLVVPHLVRRVASPLHTTLLPAAFLLGGSFLVLADTLARAVAPPLELPVGVVTALAGVPLFAVLLRRSAE